MASRGKGAKIRGDTWERDLVKFAAEHNIELERRKAGFHQDMGDLMGLDGFMVEAKAAPIAHLGQSMDKAMESWRNSGQSWMVMLQKRPNAATSHGYAVMPIWMFLSLWKEAARVGTPGINSVPGPGLAEPRRGEDLDPTPDP